MTSNLDLQKMAALLPEGVKRGTDLAGLVVGTVTGLDIPAGQVQVTVGGSEPVWVAAAPYVYAEGAKVRVRRSPLDGGRLEYCEGPLVPASPLTTGVITAVGASTLTVVVLGEEHNLQFVSSTYNVDDVVWVLLHPSGFGVPIFVMGLAAAAVFGGRPGGGASNPGQLVAREARIGPQGSGSWRSAYSRWDSWNTDRYGGPSTLWQGDAYGSGSMIGWAGHGDQVVNLQAQQITRMWVDVIRADTSTSAVRSAVLQGSPNGSRPSGAPTGFGDTTSTGGLTPGAGQRIELPASTYEAWRTGALKGLITVGGDYAGFYGTARGEAMALTVQYTVLA